MLFTLIVMTQFGSQWTVTPVVPLLLLARGPALLPWPHQRLTRAVALAAGVAGYIGSKE